MLSQLQPVYTKTLYVVNNICSTLHNAIYNIINGDQKQENIVESTNNNALDTTKKEINDTIKEKQITIANTNDEIGEKKHINNTKTATENNAFLYLLQENKIPNNCAVIQDDIEQELANMTTDCSDIELETDVEYDSKKDKLPITYERYTNETNNNNKEDNDNKKLSIQEHINDDTDTNISILPSPCRIQSIQTMDALAINIVIKPTGSIVDEQIVPANQFLVNKYNSFSFNENCIPHITLCQLYIRRIDLTYFFKRLECCISEKFEYTSLNKDMNIDTVFDIDDCINLPCIKVKKVSIIQNLHELIVDLATPFCLKPFYKYVKYCLLYIIRYIIYYYSRRANASIDKDTRKEMIYSQAEYAQKFFYDLETVITNDTIEYADTFIDNHSKSNFSPHITLGYADNIHEANTILYDILKNSMNSYSFPLQSVEIYQMGRFSTCTNFLHKIMVP